MHIEIGGKKRVERDRIKVFVGQRFIYASPCVCAYSTTSTRENISCEKGNHKP